MGCPEVAERNPLNTICPYYTMFPLEFPLGQLRGANARDWVLDPFCGRGTTVYAARLLGLRSVGVDSNPVAAAIADAKLVSVRPSEVMKAATDILATLDRRPIDVPNGEFWQWCYHPDTLRDLCVLRAALLTERPTHPIRALRAFLLGRLHGPLANGDASYLSNQMPRTYASKPGYSVKYWQSRGMRPPKVDVVDLIRRKVKHYFARLPRNPGGHIVCGDSRKVTLGKLRARWVVTSPPYYGMRTYVPDQWLRYWFLGGPADVAYTFDQQLQHSSPETFKEQLAQVWRNVGTACTPGARMVIRFGGIHDRKAEPRDLLRESIRHASCGWRLLTARSAGLATYGRRQVVQFMTTPEKPIEEYDFYARLEN